MPIEKQKTELTRPIQARQKAARLIGSEPRGKMNSSTLKILINSLNRKGFIEYIYQLWCLLNNSDESDFTKTKPMSEFGGDVFEQHHYRKYNGVGIPEQQGYNLIIPYFYPVELFSELENINISFPYFKTILKRYKQIMNDRESEWQFWTDGNYIMPLISFMTNFVDIPHDTYSDVLIPKFENLIEDLNITATTAVGSCDSFTELKPSNSILAFENFLERYKSDLSISIHEDKVKFEYCSCEKYLTSGVLSESKSPCEPIFIHKDFNQSELIKELECLINTRADEKLLEQFLSEHYRTIFGFQYDRIETQLWLRFPALDMNNRRLDIFLRNSIERDWELFELKKIMKLSRTYRDVPVFMNEIYLAIQQMKNYKRILSQDSVKQKLSLEGIEYYHPELRLVIGSKPDISLDQWRWLKSSNENNLKIITYDDLLSEMRLRYKNQGEVQKLVI